MEGYFTQARRALWANKVRTLLTTLGVVIGIATVILVLSVGEGFKSYINSQMEAFGTNTVFIETSAPPTTRQRNQREGGPASADTSVVVTTLKSRDIEEICRLPNVTGAYGALLGQKVAAYGSIRKNAFVFGADADRFSIDTGELAAGRFYTEREDRSLSQVAVLGSSIAADLFGEEDPVGKTVRLGEYNFQVIGVYEPRGGLAFSNDDQQVFVPLQTLQKKVLGIDYLFYAVVQVDNPDLAAATAEDIREVLRRSHQISDPAKDDFLVQTQAQGMETFNTILSAITFLLIAIAAISLIVGGVGVMNIMYVSVTERISEIGLKKAVGARSRDILLEFLVESVLITLLGGAIGIALGALLSFAVAQIAGLLGFAWKFIVPLSGIIVGLLVSLSIGLLFGVLPARNAARKNPIDALRYE